MRKTRIVLASILKPVNDTRMYEKLGLSLVKLPDTEVHICGYPAPASPPQSNLYLHPLKAFKRLSLERFFAQGQYLKQLFKIRPKLIIITTHELLPLTMFYKLLNNCKVVYDVQENYYLNLTQQNVYPPLLRQLMGGAIRYMEWCSSFFIDHFILAEACYAAELPFLHKRFTILENKYQPDKNEPAPQKAFPAQIPEKQVKMLFSGTLSGHTGVFEAINLCESLNHIQPSFTLSIIGYCAQTEVYLKLLRELEKRPYIKLIGGTQLVPHAEILEQIRQHDVGLIAYRPNPSTSRCTPTKLFEYLAHGLPVIVQQNPLWEKWINRHEAGFSINFQKFDAKTVYSQLLNTSFYPNGIPQEVYWKNEEPKLIALAQKLIKD